MRTTDTAEAAAYTELSRAINSFSFDPEVFADAVLADHRTLQQTMGRVVSAVIQGWAADYDQGRFDARNEATVTWAAKIAHAIEPLAAPYV